MTQADRTGRRDSLRQGIAEAVAGNRLLARLHLEDAAAANPADPNCWIWLAWTADAPAGAVRCLERVLSIDPDHELAQWGLRWAQALEQLSVRGVPGAAADTPASFAPERTPPVRNDLCDTAPFVAISGLDRDEAIDEDFDDNDHVNDELSRTAEYSETTEDQFETFGETGFSDAWSAQDFSHEPHDVFPDRASEAEEDPFSLSTPEEVSVAPSVPADDPIELNSLAIGEDVPEYSYEQTYSNAEVQPDPLVSRAVFPVPASPPAIPAPAAPIAPVAPVAAPVPTSRDAEEQVVAEVEEVRSEISQFLAEANPEPVAAPPAPPRATPPTPQKAAPPVPPAPTPAAPVPPAPVAARPAAPVAEVPIPEAAEEAPVIVAVDDSATVRKLVSLTLEKIGYKVFTAEDGMNAVDVIAKTNPGLVLLDINMPRLNGYQLCKLIKKHERTRTIPVIMLSGKDGVFDKLRGTLVGCDDYITKPFESSELARKVAAYLPLPVTSA